MNAIKPPAVFDDVAEPFRSRWLAQSRLIIESYARLIGWPLIPPAADALAGARALYAASIAVLSHDTGTDPILNYGNRTALELWQTGIEALTATPSRLTAEPMAREAREKIMSEVARTGFVTGYSGVRVTATGKRFRIENVTIFNLAHPDGTFAGQAATFDRWSAVES